LIVIGLIFSYVLNYVKSEPHDVEVYNTINKYIENNKHQIQEDWFRHNIAYAMSIGYVRDTITADQYLEKEVLYKFGIEDYCIYNKQKQLLIKKSIQDSLSKEQLYLEYLKINCSK
jgi:hypothetical protein